ncbi:MAG: hypothetical protein V3V49_06995 [Candidatus Krumholzibacteria bacterium]
MRFQCQVKSTVCLKARVLALIDNFENVMDAGSNAQSKHLIGLLVKKVLVQHRDTIEVLY